MKNLSKVSKFFLFLSALAFSLWLGGYVVRQLVIYQFFEPENLSLRPLYNFVNLKIVFITISPIILFNIITFPAFILSFLIFSLTNKIEFKKEGWLFIVSLVIIITAPFEFFLLFKDYKIFNGIYYETISSEILIGMIKERMQVFSSFSLIEIFSYIGIIFLFVFRPLRKSNEN